MIAKLPDQLESLPEVSEFLKSFGRSIALSKMCAVDSESQGEVIAMEVLLTGKSPRQIGLEMSERYNMMHGKLATKSEAILSDFQAAGGRSRIIARTPELASIELTIDGDTQTFSFSWDDAQGEPYVYDGKEGDVLKKLQNDRKGLTIKAKYATRRSRMQMLWSRVSSDGVRAMRPSCTRGAYTPDEIADIVEGNGGVAVMPQETEAEETGETKSLPSVKATKAKSKETASPATTETSDVQKVEATVAANEVAYVTTAQVEEINSIFAAMQIDETKRQGILAKRNVSSVRSLTEVQAAGLLTNLRQLAASNAAKELLAKKEAQAEAAANDTETSMSIAGPATEEQVTAIKAAISAAMQAGAKGLADEIKAHLQSNGLGKLADMCWADARDMIEALKSKNMAAFFQQALVKYEANPEATPFDTDDAGSK